MAHVTGNHSTVLPEMTGALSDDVPRRQSHSISGSHRSVDHVTSAEANDPGIPVTSSQRRHSFFVVTELRRDAAGEIVPPERIDVKRARKVRTFELGEAEERHEIRARPSSLEAILRAPRITPALPTQVQLPLSDTESTLSNRDSILEIPPGSQASGHTRSSLDIITRYDPFSHPRIPPASIPLPGSERDSIEEVAPPQDREQQMNGQQQQERQSHQSPLQIFNYQQIVAFASEILPHLTTGRIHVYSRHDDLNISYVDYAPSFRSPLISPGDVRNDRIIKQLGTIPSKVKQRLIIVEDLSPRTIYCLGTRFGVSPEFFEEHLINSGYDGAEYNDPPSQTWTTSGMRKSHCSVRWHRPVFRLPVVPYSKQDLKDLLDPACGRVEYTSDMSNHLKISQTERNIFRSEWELWTDPKITTRAKRICGWEERASIWTQTLPERDCRIVIMLLDPLPTLGEGIERDVLAARRVASSSGSHSSRSASSSGMGIDDAIALDRLAEHIKERYTKQAPVSRLQRIRDFLLPKPQLNEDSGSESTQVFEIVETTKFKKIRSVSVFEQIAPRASFDIDFERTLQDPRLMEMLRQHLQNTRSTAEDFYEQLQKTEIRDTGNHFGVLEPLFQIMRQDALSLLKLLHRTLDNINVEILDEQKMEESLSIWRDLISRAQLELPELKRSMAHFLSTFGNLGPTSDTSSAGRGNNISKDFDDITNSIDATLQRLQTASASLTSNMALLDSRRSIAEAQAVTKLTELAFFFIPLTFAASLFGMQVDTFEDRAPLSTFIILGITFTAFSYLVRLTIRSQWLRARRQAYNASIKVYADSKRLPARQKGSVPASLFLRWLAYKMRSAFFVFVIGCRTWLTETLPEMMATFWHLTEFIINTFLMVGVIAAGPISLIWTRSMDHGVQAIITIVILVSVICLVVVPYWKYADENTRSAIPNLLRKRFKRLNINKSRPLMVLFISLVLAIPVVPLAVIWTKPVSPGIKAAITVVIVLIVLVVLISWGIYHLISVARGAFNDTDSSDSNSIGSTLHS